MQLKTSKGYDGGQAIGQRLLFVFWGSGPTSYSQTTGDPLQGPYGEYIDSVSVCMDTTGTYLAVPYPSVAGSSRASWAFKYYTAAGMTQVAGGTNLSTYNFQFQATAGNF